MAMRRRSLQCPLPVLNTHIIVVIIIVTIIISIIFIISGGRDIKCNLHSVKGQGWRKYIATASGAGRAGGTLNETFTQ